MKQKNLFIVLALTGALYTSCSQDESINVTPSGTTSDGMFKFSLKAASDIGTSGDVISSLHSYAFSDGQFVKKFNNLDVTTDNFKLSLPADKPKNLFFLANHAALTITEGNSAESTFLEATSGSAALTPPTIFLSAKSTVGTNATETADVSLVRGVARIDIDPGIDDKIKIDSIVYRGGADRTFLFQDSPTPIPADAVGVVYKKKYDTPLSGGAGVAKSEIFNVYENGTREVKISIYAKFNGVNTEVQATAPSMKRNKIYTLKLQGIGQEITVNIGIKDWEIGDDIIATPTE